MLKMSVLRIGAKIIIMTAWEVQFPNFPFSIILAEFDSANRSFVYQSHPVAHSLFGYFEFWLISHWRKCSTTWTAWDWIYRSTIWHMNVCFHVHFLVFFRISFCLHSLQLWLSIRCISLANLLLLLLLLSLRKKWINFLSCFVARERRYDKWTVYRYTCVQNWRIYRNARNIHHTNCNKQRVSTYYILYVHKNRNR